MPLTGGVKEYRTFVKGIITEASALTFPENATIDEANFILNRDGSRQRRLGMDFESGYSLVNTDKTASFYDNYSITAYRWDNAGGDVNISIGVIQIGNELWFVDLYAAAQSAALLNGGVQLVLTTNGQKPYQMADVNGYLIVATGEGSPFYLTYDSATDSITKTDLDIQVRDTFGLDDGLAVDTRPTVLSDEHEYNLLNQGWDSTKIAAVFADGTINAYPSNADVWHIAKNSSDDFDTDLLEKQDFGTSPAAKGRYIISALGDRSADRSSLSGLALSTDVENGKVGTVATQSGRVWYSGINSSVTSSDAKSPNFNGAVFFSKTIENVSDFSKCYQEADPTSEHISDLVDTDGGYISIPEASNIFKLVPVRDSIVVIAESGVWQISGGDSGFTATSFQVNKITNVGAVNGESVVQAEDTIYYWSKGGIYVLTTDQISGLLSAVNLSETTIQTLYIDIPSVSKSNAVGSYDTTSKKVSWLYEDADTYTGVTGRNLYTKELVFDTVLQAFYKNAISSHTNYTPVVNAYLTTPSFLSVTDTQNVVVNGEQVQVNGEDVVVSQQVRGRGSSTTKYLVTKLNSSTNKYEFTFSQYNSRDFVDWKSVDAVGVNYSSYMITGYETGGDIMRNKQSGYAVFHFKRTENGFTGTDNQLELANPSSCFVQARWDFSDSSNSGKWGTKFQAYRLKRNYIPDNVGDAFDYGYEVITTKNKLRGKGKALSLRIESEAGKDMHLLGWGLSIMGGSVV